MTTVVVLSAFSSLKLQDLYCSNFGDVHRSQTNILRKRLNRNHIKEFLPVNLQRKLNAYTDM